MVWVLFCARYKFASDQRDETRLELDICVVGEDDRSILDGDACKLRGALVNEKGQAGRDVD